MKRMPLLIITAVSLQLSGCSDEDDGIVETTLPPGTARIVLTHMTATESQVTNVTTTVDSANARFETVTCVAAGTSACPPTGSQSGDVSESALDQLFVAAQSEAFRALQSEYKTGSEDSAPDGGWMILTVRAGSIEKTVQWEANYAVPEVLARFVCWIDGVRGSLSLCG